MNALTPGIRCPKGSLSLAWERLGNPSLCMNNNLLVVLALVLVKEYLFLVPETFGNIL